MRDIRAKNFGKPHPIRFMFIFLDNIGLDVWGGRKDEFDVMKIYLLNKFDDDWGLWNGNKRIH